MPQPTSGNNLLRVSAAAGQLSAAGTTCTKQQYGGCNPHEVKVYGGCGPHEVNVLRVPPARCKNTAGGTDSTFTAYGYVPVQYVYFMRPVPAVYFYFVWVTPTVRTVASRRWYPPHSAAQLQPTPAASYYHWRVPAKSLYSSI